MWWVLGNRSTTVTIGVGAPIVGIIKSKDEQGADINMGRIQRVERREIAKNHGMSTRPGKIRKDQERSGKTKNLAINR